MDRIDGALCDCDMGLLADGSPCPRCTYGAIRERQLESEQRARDGHLEPISAHEVARVIPRRYRDNDASALTDLFLNEPTKLNALLWVEKWTRQPWSVQKNESLFLFGPVGTGKTTIAMYALRRFMANGHSARYVSWSEWLAMIESLGYRESQAEVIDLTRVPVLLIDDLGSPDRTAGRNNVLSPETNKRQDIARLVINSRLNKAVPTIITTNLSPAQFGIMFGERVQSRVAGDFKIIEVNGADLRVLMGVNK